MDLFDVGRSCIRRWYVLIPLLIVTLWMSHSAYTSVKPVYYSNAVIGFAPPSNRIDQAEPGVAVPRNGLLDVGGATLIASMTAVGLRQPAVVDQIVTAGGAATYGAQLFPVPVNTPPMPLVMIEQTSPDPGTATKTLELVIADTNNVLQGLQQQAQVPPDQMVTSFVVSPPSPPAAGMPSRTQSTVAMFLGGAGLSILITVVVDVFLARRRTRVRRKRQMAGDGAGADGGPARTRHQDDPPEPEETIAAQAKAATDAP